MSTVQRLAKNIGILLIAQIITYVLGFFITMYTARYLGAGGLGILATALSLTGILAIFSDLGTGTLMIREVARDTSLANKYLSNVVFIRVFLIFLMIGMTVLTVFFFKYDQLTTIVIYLITLSVIIGGFNGVINAIFQSNQKMEYVSIGIIINSILMLIGTLFCIYYELSVIYFAILYVLSNILVFIYIITVYIWKFSLPKVEINLGFSKEIILMALPLSMASIFTLIAFRIDIVMLSVIKDSVAVGYYSASYRFMEVFIFIPGVFATAIFPVFSSFYVSSKESLKNSYQKSFKYLMILSLPIAAGTTVLAEPIILLIYKSSFEPSILVLQILIWAIPIIFLNYITGTILPAMDRQNLLLKLTFIAMVFNVLLNLLILPTFSYVGAAVVTILTEFLVFSTCFYILNRTFHKVRIQDSFIKPAIASAVMAVFLILLNLNLFVMILLGAVVYFIVLFALKTFNDEDYDILRLIFKKKNE
ncbi:MAG: flippase [Methanobacteriaceae archaeon]|nr:flippase [Methanobacteriaceae archaeon]